MLLRHAAFLVFILLYLSTCAQTTAQIVTSDYATLAVDLSVCTNPIAMQVDSQGRMFLACATGIYLAHPGGGITELANFTICSDGRSLVLHPNGTLFFGCSGGSRGVGRLDVSQDGLSVQHTPLISANQCRTPSPTSLQLINNHTLLMACSNSYSAIVDLTTRNITLLPHLDTSCGAISITHYWDQSFLYILAACNQGLVQLNFNTSVVKVLASSNSDCRAPQSITRDNRAGIIYGACRDSGILQIIGPNITTLISDHDCTDASFAIFDPLHGVLLASCPYHGVIAVAGSSLVTLANYAQCAGSPYTTVANGLIYGVCSGTGILQFSGSSLSTLVTYVQCRNPTSIVFDRSDGAVVASCMNGIQKITGNSISPLANSTQCYGPIGVWQSSIPNVLLGSCGATGLISINTTDESVEYLLTELTFCGGVSSLYSDSPDILILGCYGGGVVPFNRTSRGFGSVLIPGNVCGDVYGIDKDVSTNTLYVACSSLGIVSVNLNKNGSYVVLADVSVCKAPVSVLALEHLVLATCGDSGLLAITNSSIIMLLKHADCPGAAYMSRNPVSGMVLVACSDGGGVFQVDGSTLVTTRILSPTQSPDAYKAIQDPVTGTTFVASLSKGVIAVYLEYRCYPGFEWKIGACSPCDPQYYRSVVDLQPFSQCRPCPSGSIAPYSGSSSCSSCLAGSYDSKKQCLLCPLGKYQPSSGTTFCNDCAKGSYALLPGSTQCPSCAAGFYSNRNGSVSCSPCNSGSASDVIGLDRPCDGCIAGYYQAGIGQTSCFPCPNHFYSEQANSTSCTRCANQVNADRTACNVITCNANSQFNDATNQCDLCSVSTYSNRGGLCSTCVTKTYTPAPGSGCASCDGVEGLLCYGGIAQVQEGYWAYIDTSDADSMWRDPANTNSTTYYYTYRTARCPDGFCDGTVLQSTDAVTSEGFSSTTVVQYCSWPRLNSPTNHLCGQCMDGYVAWGDSCVSCNGVNGGLAFGYLVFSFCLVLFLLYSSTNIGSAGSSSIFLFFIQTCALEIGPIVRYIDWIQIANLDPKSAGSCLAPWSAYGQMLFALFIPIILMVELMIIAIIHFSLHKVIGSSSESVDSSDGNNKIAHFILVRLRRFSIHDYYVGVLAILLFCYTQVSTASIRYLHCVDVGSLAKLNFSAPTIDCRSDEYKRYLIPVIIAIIVYVIGLPVVAFLKLWRNRDTLYSTADSKSSSSNANSSIESSASPTTSDNSNSSFTTYASNFQYHWSPVYRMYARHAYFWQCGVLIRRAAFVVTAVLLMQQSAQRFMCYAFLHFASLQVHLYIKPYQDHHLNQMETASYMLLVCISLMLTAYTPPYQEAVQVMLFIMIVPATIAMFGFIIWQRWHEWKNKNTKQDGAFGIDQTAPEHEIVSHVHANGSKGNFHEEAISLGSVTPSIAAPADIRSSVSPIASSNRDIELSAMPAASGVVHNLSDEILPAHALASDSEVL